MVILRVGWLIRQLDQVENDVKQWPEWMRREASFADSASGSDGEGVEPAEGVKAMKAGVEEG